MFVTATFHSSTVERHASVPAGARAFRRVEVVAGSLLPDNQQEIVSGIQPGDRVVANALVLQNTVEQ